VAQLQQQKNEQAPYHVLYYDATLVAYRTDKFTGWKNQPADGTPFFGLGPVGYTLLKPASGGGGDVAAEDSLLIPLVALLAAAGVFLALRSRRGKRRTDEE